MEGKMNRTVVKKQVLMRSREWENPGEGFEEVGAVGSNESTRLPLSTLIFFPCKRKKRVLMRRSSYEWIKEKEKWRKWM